LGVRFIGNQEVTRAVAFELNGVAFEREWARF
jgi:hypothetical protein